MVFLYNDENRSRKILETLKGRQQPVILYGASDCGQKYFDILTKYGIEVAFFYDDDPLKQETLFCGKIVISRDQMYASKEQIVISSWGPQKILRKLHVMNEEIAKRCIVLDLYLWVSVKSSGVSPPKQKGQPSLADH